MTQNTLTTRGGRAAEAAGRAELAPLPHATTVLVAEDDPEVRHMLRASLGTRGYKVVESADGQETLEIARAERPDVILMDLQLPRLNGFAVARFIRQTDALRAVPIIVVSAHDPAKHRNLALAAGCNAYIQKPIDLDHLDETILSLLKKK